MKSADFSWDPIGSPCLVGGHSAHRQLHVSQRRDLFHVELSMMLTKGLHVLYPLLPQLLLRDSDSSLHVSKEINPHFQSLIWQRTRLTFFVVNHGQCTSTLFVWIGRSNEALQGSQDV